MNTKFGKLSVLFALFILAGCAPSESAIQVAIVQTQSAWTPIPTQTFQPTYTPYPTFTPLPTLTPPPTIAVEVTRVIVQVVTVTPTNTPLYTPTNTGTPTKTPLPTQTPNATQTAQAKLTAKLQADKGDGFYLVNVDIAPGVWRSMGTTDNCYWATTTKTGKILDNHFGMSGGTAYVSPSAFQVEFKDCGKWVFVSPP